MIDATQPLPGAPTKYPYKCAPSASEALKMFDNCICDGKTECAYCKSLHSPLETSEREAIDIPIEIPPDQPSLASTDFTAIYRTLPLATDAEVDELIETLDALKLERLLRQRRICEESLDTLREELREAAMAGAGLNEFADIYYRMDAENKNYCECTRSINAMIQRGVTI